MDSWNAAGTAVGDSLDGLEPIPMDDVAASPVLQQGWTSATASACDICGSRDFCCCAYVGCLFDWRRAEFWLGVNGFTGPGNFLLPAAQSAGEVEGSFGFQEGFNFGS
jgi:hypothetical protein